MIKKPLAYYIFVTFEKYNCFECLFSVIAPKPSFGLSWNNHKWSCKGFTQLKWTISYVEIGGLIGPIGSIISLIGGLISLIGGLIGGVISGLIGLIDVSGGLRPPADSKVGWGKKWHTSSSFRGKTE